MVIGGKSRCLYAKAALFLLLSFFTFPFDVRCGNEALQSIEGPVVKAVETRADTRRRLDAWEIEKARLARLYDDLGRENERLKEELDDLSARAKELEELNSSLEKSIADSRRVSQELKPFLSGVYRRIKGFVEADLPFLATERLDRLDGFRRALEDPSSGIDVAFAKMMETLFAEAGYGNSCAVYPDKVMLGGKDLMVNVLRVGRVALFCATPDGGLCGYFSVADAKWRALPAKWNRDIGEAIDMVQKRRPADLVCLPIGRLGVEKADGR